MAIPWQVLLWGADALMKSSADKKLQKRTRQQQEVMDQIDQYVVEDQEKLMRDINLKDEYMLGMTTPALWETTQGVVNPINPVLQAAKNAEEYNAVIDTGALTDYKPTGYVAEGFDPAIAAAAASVTEGANIDNALKGDIQAMAVEGPRLGQMAMNRLNTINVLRGTGKNLARQMGIEQFVENPEIVKLQKQAKELGLPITAPPNLAALGGTISAMQNEKALRDIFKAGQTNVAGVKSLDLGGTG